jgi:preprotein translocase subunit SecA
MVSRAIENAQKRVEGHNFEIRKTLLDFDNVMNQQREVIYTLRRELMQEKDLEPVAMEFLDDLLDDIYAPLGDAGQDETGESGQLVRARLRDSINLDRVLPADAPLPGEKQARDLALTVMEELKAQSGPMYQDILRYFLLGELDRCWKEHLRDMDFLRDGIGLQGYAQRDPKIEYKKQGFAMFQHLLLRIREGAFRTFTRLRIEQPAQEDFQHREKIPEAPPAPAEGPSGTVRNASKIGRNDPCPCGSGKKYKKCCGAKER